MLSTTLVTGFIFIAKCKFSHKVTSFLSLKKIEILEIQHLKDGKALADPLVLLMPMADDDHLQ